MWCYTQACCAGVRHGLTVSTEIALGSSTGKAPHMKSPTLLYFCLCVCIITDGAQGLRPALCSGIVLGGPDVIEPRLAVCIANTPPTYYHSGVPTLLLTEQDSHTISSVWVFNSEVDWDLCNIIIFFQIISRIFFFNCESLQLACVLCGFFLINDKIVLRCNQESYQETGVITLLHTWNLAYFQKMNQFHPSELFRCLKPFIFYIMYNFSFYTFFPSFRELLGSTKRAAKGSEQRQDTSFFLE